MQRHLAYLDDQLPPPLPGSAGLQHSTISLPTGHLDLTHPRDAMHLIYQQNFGADGTDPPYWAQPWPCGVELARAVAAAVTPGTRVLELGCGLALPSLAAARAGGHVLATDHVESALAFVAYNARRNHVSLEVETCSWADPTAAIAGAPWDIVLAADVLYRHTGLDALHALLPRLVDHTGEIWIADQARPPAGEFLTACSLWATTTTTRTANPDVTIHQLRPRMTANSGRPHQPQEPGPPLNGPTTSAVIHPP